MKFVLIILLLSIFSCKKETVNKPIEEVKTETLIEIIETEEIKIKKEIKLWATMYYTKILKSVNEGVSIRDKNGRPFPHKLNQGDWCRMAIEGSGIVDNVSYNYAGVSSAYKVRCPHKASGKVKYKLSKYKWGEGNKSNPLRPFHSLATDQRVIPYGAKVFIPEAKGVKYFIDKKEYTHNGIFYADDVGGAIKNNHIDVFVGGVIGGLKGAMKINPFNFIHSSSSRTFKAYIIE